MKVLIIDDNQQYVTRLIELIQEVMPVADIITVATYEEAIKSLVWEMPALVLLDINLPGRNGLDILHYIRRQNLPCTLMILSNHSDHYYRKMCMDSGVDYFLDKSNDFAQVPLIIKNLADRMFVSSK